MSPKLSNWYFSECGGLLLTPQARDFYFALQDLLRAAFTCPGDWDAIRSEEAEGDEKTILKAILAEKGAQGAMGVLDYLSSGSLEDWQEKAPNLAKAWKKGIKDVAADWNKLEQRQRFATLQQVGSILRTSLVNDLESRVH